jgi:hypothetical protein
MSGRFTIDFMIRGWRATSAGPSNTEVEQLTGGDALGGGVLAASGCKVSGN